MSISQSINHGTDIVGSQSEASKDAWSSGHFSSGQSALKAASNPRIEKSADFLKLAGSIQCEAMWGQNFDSLNRDANGGFP